MTDLPPGWEWTTLEELASPEPRSITDGPFGSNLKSSHYTASGARVFRLQNIGDGAFRDERAYISLEHFEQLRAHEAREGDLLIASLGEAPPRACLVPSLSEPAIVKADCIRIRLAAHVEPHWVLYSLLSPATKRHAAALLKGVGRPRLGLHQIRSIPIPLPPLAEQRRIVDTLEAHLSRLDAGSSILDAAINRLQCYRDRFITSAVAGIETTSVEHASPPEYAGVDDGILPDIPTTWSWRRLGELADVVGGITKDSKKQTDTSLPEVPYLRVANVQRGKIKMDDVATIRAPQTKIDQLSLLAGDVLLNEGGDRDKLARGWVWEGQLPVCIHQNHVFRARIKDDQLHPKLLAWHANSFGKGWAETNGKQSVNLASISLSKIRLLPVPVPPRDEQDRLVGHIENHLATVDRQLAAIHVAQQRATLLRRSLLAEAFAGRLVNQDSDDEPASLLLERINAERAAQPKVKRTRKSKPAQETLL